MAVKIKESAKQNDSTYTPRFDFGVSLNSNENQTATIKELLAELNYEKSTKSSGVQSDKHGKQIDISYLETTLRFLRTISGQALRSTTEEHPIAAVKTIKTIFNYNHDSGVHLIGLIEPPGSESKAILDILTSPPTSNKEKFLSIKDRINGDIEKEISPKEKAEIAAICDPVRLREKYLQDTNEVIDRILLTHIHIDDDLMKEADDYLADKTRQFLKSITPIKPESRLHVATYINLKLLDYVHRLHFEISTQLTIPSACIVDNMHVDFDLTCGKLSTTHGKSIAKDTNFMSIDEVTGFIDGYASDIARLVSIATGFKYNKRDILGKKKNEQGHVTDSTRALITIQLYLLAADLPNDKNPKPIGVVHVIAAFCSVLHQRKLKPGKKKTSLKYKLLFDAPQKKLDAHITGKSKHLLYTAQFIYLERMRWYVHALLDRKDKANSHVAVQVAQSELNRDIFMSLDHAWILKQINAYRDFMENAAHDFVFMHKKQSTTYEWMHGS